MASLAQPAVIFLLTLCCVVTCMPGSRSVNESAGRHPHEWIEDYTNGLSGALATIDALKEQVSALEAHQSVIGYKYAARHSAHSDLDSGRLTTMRFTKKRPLSILRLSFMQNVGIYSGTTLESRWYFKIDGLECQTPAKLDMILRFENAGRHWLGVPSVLKGICATTSSGHIGKGEHTISVYVGTAAGRTRSPDAYSGWKSTSLLEVQEIPAPY